MSRDQAPHLEKLVVEPQPHFRLMQEPGVPPWMEKGWVDGVCDTIVWESDRGTDFDTLDDDVDTYEVVYRIRPTTGAHSMTRRPAEKCVLCERWHFTGKRLCQDCAWKSWATGREPMSKAEVLGRDVLAGKATVADRHDNCHGVPLCKDHPC